MSSIANDNSELPPLPQPLFDTPLPEVEPSMETVRAKLWNVWRLYGALVQDEALWKVLHKPSQPESDKFKVQSSLVWAIHHLGTILHGVPEDIDYINRQIPATEETKAT